MFFNPEFPTGKILKKYGDYGDCFGKGLMRRTLLPHTPAPAAMRQWAKPVFFIAQTCITKEDDTKFLVIHLRERSP